MELLCYACFPGKCTCASSKTKLRVSLYCCTLFIQFAKDQKSGLSDNGQ